MFGHLELSMHLNDLDPLGHDALDQVPRTKSYVVNFWASWCPPCRKELPWLDRLAEHGTEVVGISRDVRVQLALDEIRGRTVRFPNYSDLPGDFTAYLGEVLPYNGIPATIIVSEGRVRWVHVGPFASYDELERTVADRISSAGPEPSPRSSGR